MGKDYFLFGKEAVSVFTYGDLNDLIEFINDGGDHLLYEFTTPAELLYNYNGYEDYACLTEEEWTTIHELTI